MDASPTTIVAIAGSLRHGSFNRGLVRAAQELAADDVRVEPFDLTGVPLYDGDLESEGDPPEVARLKSALAGADALLVATPEYNHSLPGVLKNALDWASRAPERALTGLPVGLAGASPGRLGAARGVQAARLTLAGAGALVMPAPAVHVGEARERFDADGNLVDETVRGLMADLVAQLAAWAATLGGARRP